MLLTQYFAQDIRQNAVVFEVGDIHFSVQACDDFKVDLPAGGGGCRYHAGAHGPAVDVNRAGAALRDAATELGSTQPQVIANDPQQRRARIAVEVTLALPPR